MTLADGFQWLGQTAPGLFLKNSTVAFAAVESTHILGLALLGGTVLAVDLAGLGVIFRKAAPAETARSLAPLFWVALAIMAVSGVLLVAAGPFKYYTNPLFPWKLGVLALALLVQGWLYWRLTRMRARSVLTGLLAAVSLLLWLAVTILGRWLGLI